MPPPDLSETDLADATSNCGASRFHFASKRISNLYEGAFSFFDDNMPIIASMTKRPGRTNTGSDTHISYSGSAAPLPFFRTATPRTAFSICGQTLLVLCSVGLIHATL